MKYVTPANSNAAFHAPNEWDESVDGKCGTLPVRVSVGQGGRKYHTSAWKPDEHELRRLNEGGIIELLCVGIQPPVALSVVPNAD